MSKEHEQAIVIKGNPKANNYTKKCFKLLVITEIEKWNNNEIMIYNY